MLWQAIYEGGVFRPTHPVHLPEGSLVVVQLPDELPPEVEGGRDRLYALLSQSFDTDQPDASDVVRSATRARSPGAILCPR